MVTTGISLWSCSTFYAEQEDYNLESLQVPSVSLSWSPYLVIGDCDSNGMNCFSNFGMLPDLTDKLGRMFNVSILSLKDTSEDWGIYPKSGSFDFTGEWGGVMGKVQRSTLSHWMVLLANNSSTVSFQIIKGEYPLSLSTWSLRPDRAQIMDYVGFKNEYNILMLIPQPPKVDFALFIRPFTANVWAILFSILLVLAFTIALRLLVERKTSLHVSFRIIHACVMVFVILVNAYYGGALTMFFSTEAKVSFKSLMDVLRDPSWNIVIRNGCHVQVKGLKILLLFFSGSESWYYFLRDRYGDKEYVRLVDTLEERPEEIFYGDLGEAMKRMENGRYTIQKRSEQKY